MTRPFDFRDKTVLITGAGGGIGQALAATLAARGARLALVDVSRPGLARTLADLPTGTRATPYGLDVADRRAIEALPAAIQRDFGGLDVLVNNAGVALGGAFEQVSQTDFERLFEINFWGVVRMTRAFLPLLRASADARLVNLSSIFGIVSPGGQAAYSASKFAVRGFSNALAQELAGTTVGVTVVHPGGVRTAIARSAKEPDGLSSAEIAQQRAAIEKSLRMEPARAAAIIARAIERRRARVLVGGDAKIAALLERIAPVGHFAWIRAFQNRQKAR